MVYGSNFFKDNDTGAWQPFWTFYQKGGTIERMSTIDKQPIDRPNIPRVGEGAPDFRLPNASGEERRLSDLVKQRSTILVFYRGHW